MPRLTGPDQPQRVFYFTTGTRKGTIVPPGTQVPLYADAQCTTAADVRNLDGSPITGTIPTVVVGDTLEVPLFQFPDVPDPVVYTRIAGGPVVALHPRTDDRIDALTAALTAAVSAMTTAWTDADTTAGVAARNAAVDAVSGALPPRTLTLVQGLLASSAVYTSGPVSPFGASPQQALIPTRVVASGDATYTVKVQHSPDGATNWTDQSGGTYTPAETGGRYTLNQSVTPQGRHIRFVITSPATVNLQSRVVFG